MGATAAKTASSFGSSSKGGTTSTSNKSAVQVGTNVSNLGFQGQTNAATGKATIPTATSTVKNQPTATIYGGGNTPIYSSVSKGGTAPQTTGSISVGGKTISAATINSAISSLTSKGMTQAQAINSVANALKSGSTSSLSPTSTGGSSTAKPVSSSTPSPVMSAVQKGLQTIFPSANAANVLDINQLGGTGVKGTIGGYGQAAGKAGSLGATQGNQFGGTGASGSRGGGVTTTPSGTGNANAAVNTGNVNTPNISNQIKNTVADNMRGDGGSNLGTTPNKGNPNDKMNQFKSGNDKNVPPTKTITNTPTDTRPEINTPTDLRPEINTPTDLRPQAANIPGGKTMEFGGKTVDEATIKSALDTYTSQGMTYQQAMQKVADDVKAGKLGTETSLYNLNNTLGKSEGGDITKELTDQMKVGNKGMNQLAEGQNKPEEEAYKAKSENTKGFEEYKNDATDPNTGALAQNITDRFGDIEKSKAEMLDKIKFMDTAKQQITMLQSNEALQGIMRQYMAQGMSEQEARNQAQADLGKQIMNERKGLLDAQVQTANAQKDIIQWATNANDMIRQAKENNIKYDVGLEKVIVDMKNEALQNRANVLSNTFANYIGAMGIKNFSDLNDLKKEQVIKMADITLAGKSDPYSAQLYFNAIGPIFGSQPTRALDIYKQFRNGNFDLNTAVSTAKAAGSTPPATTTNTSNNYGQTQPVSIQTSVGTANFSGL